MRGKGVTEGREQLGDEVNERGGERGMGGE